MSKNGLCLKTLTFILLTVFTIGIVITFIAYHFDNPNNLNFISFFIAILIRSIALSFFPVILLVFYFEGILYKENHLNALKIIDEISKKTQFKEEEKERIFTFAKDTKDEILINEDDLFYIKAEGNYCHLFYKQDTVLLRKLIRSSMKDVEMCIGDSELFVRCHKSYIVNISKILNVAGNARGYLFHLAIQEQEIPGSRNLSKSLINKIKAFQNR
jgi:hypothetical protein